MVGVAAASASRRGSDFRPELWASMVLLLVLVLSSPTPLPLPLPPPWNYVRGADHVAREIVQNTVS